MLSRCVVLHKPPGNPWSQMDPPQMTLCVVVKLCSETKALVLMYESDKNLQQKRFEFCLLFVLISFHSDIILNILFFGESASQTHILF